MNSPKKRKDMVMKRMIMALVSLTLVANVYANSAPVISNVSAAQRDDDSKLVDITYDLVDADGDTCTVWMSISDNGGVSWRVPVRSFSGDIGRDISPGTNKLIVWDAGVDMPGKSGTFKARVFADDGNGSASMVVVPSGWFPYQNASQTEDWIFIDNFKIDKYEVTNQFYCQFLNDANSTEPYWDTNMEIDRMGDPNNYYYTVQSGRENYPVRYVNFHDAEAFAAWRSSLDDLSYRLPTEQEWEKAAGWDPIEQHHYTYGFHWDEIDCFRCNYTFLIHVPEPTPAPCYGGPLPVGWIDGKPNTVDAKCYYGCYDMSGNVSEWTSSIYSGSKRVIRGGGWDMLDDYCRVIARACDEPSRRYESYGFRLVQDLD
jgi:formylglycine-generating enzyme required for sulfatase activity